MQRHYLNKAYTIIVSLTPEMQQSFSLFKSTTRSCCPGNTNCYYILKAELPPLLMTHYGQPTKIDTAAGNCPGMSHTTAS